MGKYNKKQNRRNSRARNTAVQLVLPMGINDAVQLALPMGMNATEPSSVSHLATLIPSDALNDTTHSDVNTSSALPTQRGDVCSAIQAQTELNNLRQFVSHRWHPSDVQKILKVIAPQYVDHLEQYQLISLWSMQLCKAHVANDTLVIGDSVTIFGGENNKSIAPPSSVSFNQNQWALIDVDAPRLTHFDDIARLIADASIQNYPLGQNANMIVANKPDHHITKGSWQSTSFTFGMGEYTLYVARYTPEPDGEKWAYFEFAHSPYHLRVISSSNGQSYLKCIVCSDEPESRVIILGELYDNDVIEVFTNRTSHFRLFHSGNFDKADAVTLSWQVASNRLSLEDFRRIYHADPIPVDHAKLLLTQRCNKFTYSSGNGAKQFTVYAPVQGGGYSKSLLPRAALKGRMYVFTRTYHPGMSSQRQITETTVFVVRDENSSELVFMMGLPHKATIRPSDGRLKYVQLLGDDTNAVVGICPHGMRFQLEGTRPYDQSEFSVPSDFHLV